MVKRLLLLISSVLLAYGLGVAPVLAKEITLWSRDTNQAQLRALVDAWNETHETQIKLTLAGSDFESKLGLAMAAGAPPDIVPIEVTQFPKFSSEGHVLDITDQARALPYFDHLIKAHTAQATYPKVGGRVYGISFFPDTAVLVYNKDLFEQAGLDPENPPLSTRAEMKEAIERITALGDDIYGFYSSFLCNGCNMFSMLPQIWASGGDVLNEDSTAATFDDPEVAAFYEFYRELWTSGQLPPSAGADTGSGYITLFQAGKSACKSQTRLVLETSLEITRSSISVSPTCPAGKAASAPLSAVTSLVFPLTRSTRMKRGSLSSGCRRKKCNWSIMQGSA